MLDLVPAQRRKLLAAATLRSLVTVAGLVFLYYVLPFDRLSSAGAIVLLLLGLVGLLLLILSEVRAILKHAWPGIRAVEALATLVPLFLLLFATLYYLLDTANRSNFSQHLNRTDALYFTVTTFSTVGYGDITPITGGARIAVMLQMISDLVVIGFGIKALVGAVRMGRQLRANPGSRPADLPGPGS